LYADFYSADIIVASPLGLRVIVGADGEEGRDFDFLASVEILVLDQADIFLMQVVNSRSFGVATQTLYCCMWIHIERSGVTES
jgi:hypothetical protein